MQNILTILKKEVAGYFNSVVAYIVGILFLGVLGYFFTSPLFFENVATMRNVFQWAPMLFIIFVPAITMRTIADEKKSGTIELLLTKPVTDMEIILGKFFGALVMVCFILLPTLIYVITLVSIGSLDAGALIGSYIGLLLMSAVYVAIGVWASSVTEYQIIAMLLSAVIIGFLYFLGFFLGLISHNFASVFEYISISYHFNNIARGVIDSRNIVYYLSGILIFLLLARTSLESRKW
ncbi:MAG: ABC transporter permease [Ignavibacteria bacterium]|nr:ABC transporter permease [Ignavibacteria bacterium]